MKRIIAALAVLFAVTAHAQVAGTNSLNTSTASQAASLNSGEGNGNTINSYAPEHQSITERNVSAPIEGAFAASFNQLNCGQTAQGGVAVAGFSLTAGASKDSFSCVLETAAAESTRQSTVTADPAVKAALQTAAVAIRCQISPEIYRAYEAAGLNCMGLKPNGYDKRNPPVVTNTDGQKVQTALVYLKAQP